MGTENGEVVTNDDVVPRYSTVSCRIILEINLKNEQTVQKIYNLMGLVQGDGIRRAEVDFELGSTRVLTVKSNGFYPVQMIIKRLQEIADLTIGGIVFDRPRISELENESRAA